MTKTEPNISKEGVCEVCKRPIIPGTEFDNEDEHICVTATNPEPEMTLELLMGGILDMYCGDGSGEPTPMLDQARKEIFTLIDKHYISRKEHEKLVNEARISELESLESDMLSSDSQWYAIGERIEELKHLRLNT